MPCKFAVATIAALISCGAHAAVAESTCDRASGTCKVPLQNDQVLLQLKKQTVSKSACGAVSRRRRHETMTACRRRHHAAGHHDSDQPGDLWKCVDNEMRCDDGSADTPITDADAPAEPETPANLPPALGSPPVGGQRPLVGFPVTGQRKAQGLWCEVDIPPADWSLKSCPSAGNTVVKALTYNLFWWNLFKRHDGSDRSAGRLIERTSSDVEYDVMGFQECEDVGRVLRDAGMADEYVAIDGGSAIAVAYRRPKWTLLDQGSEFVGEDSQQQYYGKRRAQWVRLQNSEGKIVFFINHHGPLKVSQSGGCTGSATAINIMRVISDHAHEGDVIILVGDFNAEPHSSRIVEMKKRLGHVYSGHSMGGVDHVFSNCASHGSGENLGKGDGQHGSDHDALSATFRI